MQCTFLNSTVLMGLIVHWTPTLQPRSQFSAEEHIGQLALAVALFTVVVFIKVDVVKVYTACQRNNPR